MTEQQLSLDDLAGTIPLPEVGERILFAPYVNYPDVTTKAMVVRVERVHGFWVDSALKEREHIAVEYTDPVHPEWGKDTGFCYADEYPRVWRRMT